MINFLTDVHRHEQRLRESLEDEEDTRNLNGQLKPSQEIDSPRMKRASRHVQKLNMGDSKDDIHVCIMCMRAIMNNKVSKNSYYVSACLSVYMFIIKYCSRFCQIY